MHMEVGVLFGRFVWRGVKGFLQGVRDFSKIFLGGGQKCWKFFFPLETCWNFQILRPPFRRPWSSHWLESRCHWLLVTYQISQTKTRSFKNSLL